MRPLIGDTPFASGGRVLAFGPLHLPYRGVFVAAWGRPWADADGLGAVIASLAGLQGSLGPIRGVASMGFVLLFVAGPALTVTLGPDAAVVGVAALLYPTALAGIVVLWRRRHRLGLRAPRALWVSVEILLCPAFLPNLVRKITAHHAVEADGAQVLAAAAGAEVRDEFLARLQRRAEDLIETAAPDAAAQASLRTYIANIRGTR